MILSYNKSLGLSKKIAIQVNDFYADIHPCSDLCKTLDLKNSVILSGGEPRRMGNARTFPSRSRGTWVRFKQNSQLRKGTYSLSSGLPLSGLAGDWSFSSGSFDAISTLSFNPHRSFDCGSGSSSGQRRLLASPSLRMTEFLENDFRRGLLQPLLNHA